MKYLLNLLTILTILFTLTAIQPAVAQQANEPLISNNTVIDQSSEYFQTHLDSIKAINEHLGPDYNLVFPGDTLEFIDGSKRAFEPAEPEENITVVLIDWLEAQGLNPDNLVRIIRADRPDIHIVQGSGEQYVHIPIFVWILMGVGVVALCLIVIPLWDIRDTLQGGGVDIENHHHTHNHSHNDREPGVYLLERSDFPSNTAPLVIIEGDDNTVCIGDEPKARVNESVEKGEKSETESVTEETEE